MRNSQKGLRSFVHKKKYFLFSDLEFIIRFAGEWFLDGCLILSNIKKDSKKYNQSSLSIFFNALIKYPLLGFFPIDYFCYKLYENNYKDYISQIEYYNKITRENFYLSTSITNKLFFKQAMLNKINTPKLIAYYDYKKDEIEKFAEPSNDKIIIKPTGGYQGKDIIIANSDNLIESLKKCNKNCIAEEFIQQHHMLNDIFSETVNTLRIITYIKNGDIIFIKGTLKVGQEPNVIVDNVAKGGIGINLDLKTGTLGFGYTSYKNGFIEYRAHPKTNYKFFGKAIPFLDEVKDLAVTAHRFFPTFKIIGWDIAITENGPTLVEGNIHPNITGMQLHEPLRKKLLH